MPNRNEPVDLDAMEYNSDPRGTPGRGLIESPHVATPLPPRVQYAHGPKFEDAVAAVEYELEQYRPPERMPDYVEPREGVPPVGALSAEAIVKDFEKTAKGIDAMAADLVEASQKCATELVELTAKYSDMMSDLEKVVEHIKDTSAAYRDEAKTVFLRIEDTTLRMKEVRELSDAMRERLAGASDIINEK